MNRFSDIVLTSLLALILISCQITESPQPAPISVALPTSTTISVVETATTPPPTPESTSTAIPTHTPETAVCTIPNPETIPLPESAHDTIAYISESEDEEEMLTLLATNGRWQSNTPMPGWLFQDAPTPHYLLFPTEPLNLDTPILQELFADTCQVSPEEASRSGTKPNTCYDFKVSPNQQWAAAKTNYNSCGSDLALIDLRGDVPTITKPDFLDPAAGHGIHYFRFIGDDELWLAVGHCQGGDFYILDINSGEVTWIGTAGPDRWIANRAAVAVSGGTYIGGYGTRTWGYNTETNDYFLPSTDTAGGSLWTPDRTHLLYQPRDIEINIAEDKALLSPRQIGIVDKDSGNARLLIDDPAHDYYLCGSDNRCSWAGDWIMIRRKPYQPDLVYRSESINKLADCAEYGRSCTLPLEEFALNWQTGEIVPWETAVLPTPTVIATMPPPLTGPDMNTDPIFTAEDNRYTLQKGLDQHSLWCVPQTGEPVPWVENGSNFVFVP